MELVAVMECVVTKRTRGVTELVVIKGTRGSDGMPNAAWDNMNQKAGHMEFRFNTTLLNFSRCTPNGFKTSAEKSITRPPSVQPILVQHSCCDHCLGFGKLRARRPLSEAAI
jgi:hypothetical protein